MATFVLKSTERYPVGTSVAAYPRSAWGDVSTSPPSGAPSGVALETQTVAADGTVTFTTLALDLTYYAYAAVGGQHRIVAFSVAIESETIDGSLELPSGGLYVGRTANPVYLSAFKVEAGDNQVAIRVDQEDTVNNPDAVKIVTQSTGYALKIDRSAGAADTVNIAAQVTGAHTALGVLASNTTLSTVKVTNDAVQTAGAVIAALGTSTTRSAPIFRGENSGTGPTYDHLAIENTAIGLHLKAHATQAVDMVQIKDSSGNVKLVVTNDFRMGIGQATLSSAGISLEVTGDIRANAGSMRSANGYANTSSANNSRLQTNTTGSVIDRNIADANPVLIVTQVHASSTGDILQLKNSAGTVLSVARGGAVTLADTDVVLGTTTGTKIGTATAQKLAFHNSTPVIQRAGAAQAAVVTTAATQTTPWGFSTQAQADAIVALVNEIRASLVEKGLIKGAA